MGESFLEATFGGWDRGVKMAKDEADFTLRQYALQQAAQQHQMQMAKWAQEILASQEQMQRQRSFQNALQPTQETTKYGNNPEMVESDWDKPMQSTTIKQSPLYQNIAKNISPVAAELGAKGALSPEQMYHFKQQDNVKTVGNDIVEKQPDGSWSQVYQGEQKSQTEAESAEKYRSIIAKQNMGQPLTTAESAWTRAYEKQKTLSASMPGFTVIQTDKGFEPFQTKGKGAGDFATPNGPPRQAKETPETAAKMALINQGIVDVKRAKDMLISKDGIINRKLLATAMVSLPGTSGREFNSYIYNAVEAKLRAESGAAVPAEEVTRMAKRFIPGSMDNDATVVSKIDRLGEWLGMAQKMTDPHGNRARQSGGVKRSRWNSTTSTFEPVGGQ